MEYINKKIDTFLAERSEDSIISTFGMDVKKRSVDEGNLSFFNGALSKLFTSLYEEKYLTNKPTVIVGFNKSEKFGEGIAIQLFLDK